MTKQLSQKELKAGALVGARDSGCTCNPDIELVEIMPNVYRANIAHDDWCYLLRAIEDRN